MGRVISFILAKEEITDKINTMPNKNLTIFFCFSGHTRYISPIIMELAQKEATKEEKAFIIIIYPPK